MSSSRSLFGTDGIRGVANVHPMTPELALALGRAVTFVAGRGQRHAPRVLIGKDTRLSGYMIETAIASDTEFVYLLSPQGETVARRDLGSAPLDLAVCDTSDSKLLVAGCRDGSVYVLDGRLAIRGTHPLGSQVNSVGWIRGDEGGWIVAGMADGRVVGLGIGPSR